MSDIIVEVVKASDFARALNYKILCGAEKEITFNTVNISRPGLFLAGFTEYFGNNRLQIFGNAEIEYLKKLPTDEANIALDKLAQREIPCIVIARGRECPQGLYELCCKHNIPLFSSEDNTTAATNSLIIYLNRLLAPSLSRHGGLIDVYGLGVLIVGKSGIGKSETALELVKRGHRIVADDNVIIKCINDNLFGSAPELIRNFMEIRGVGIIDVRSMYGVSAVLEEKQIELVIELENWDNKKIYDRLGTTIEHERILDVSVPKLRVPVSPGRNLAIIIEVAASNHRLKKLGYNAANEMISRSMNFNDR